MNSKKTTNLTAVSLRNSSLSLWDDQCLGSRGRRVDACSMKLDYVYRTPKLPQGKVCNRLIGQGSETGGIPRCFFTIDQLSGSGEEEWTPRSQNRIRRHLRSQHCLLHDWLVQCISYGSWRDGHLRSEIGRHAYGTPRYVKESFGRVWLDRDPKLKEKELRIVSP